MARKSISTIARELRREHGGGSQPASDTRDVDGSNGDDAGTDRDVDGSVDPSDIAAGTPPDPRNIGKRGRPFGSRNPGRSGGNASSSGAAAPKNPALAVKSLDRTLSQVHNMLGTLAVVIGFPQYANAFTLTDSESADLAAALAEFAKHHNMPAFSNKRQSEIQLLICIGGIYGKKIKDVAFPPKTIKPDEDQTNVVSFNADQQTTPIQPTNWFGT